MENLRRHSTLRLILSAAALLLVGPAAWSADVAPALEAGRDDVVTTIAGATVAGVEGFTAPTIQLAAKESRVSGTSGVNRYGGSYASVDGKLVFGQLFSTMMAAPEPAMALEQRFLAIMGTPLAVTASGGALTLSGDKGALTLH